jgi:hypothetical protein
MTDYSYEQIPNTNDILFYNSMHVNIFFEGVTETPQMTDYSYGQIPNTNDKILYSSMLFNMFFGCDKNPK